MRAIARMRSLDLSMTITAAVPSADLCSRQPSKSISRLSHSLAGRGGIREPPGRTARRVVPAAEDAAGMGVDQFAQRNAHRFFDGTGLLHVAGDAEQLRAGIVGPPD